MGGNEIEITNYYRNKARVKMAPKITIKLCTNAVKFQIKNVLPVTNWLFSTPAKNSNPLYSRLSAKIVSII